MLDPLYDAINIEHCNTLQMILDNHQDYYSYGKQDL